MAMATTLFVSLPRALQIRASSSDAIPAQQASVEVNLPCEACGGRGWTVCSFCNGQKTNVQVRKNKFYRRCPSCKAVSNDGHPNRSIASNAPVQVGATMCERCKVFRCITFPDFSDQSLS